MKTHSKKNRPDKFEKKNFNPKFKFRKKSKIQKEQYDDVVNDLLKGYLLEDLNPD